MQDIAQDWFSHTVRYYAKHSFHNYSKETTMIKALVIDDDKVTRMMFSKMLQKLSVDVTEAADGVEGIMMTEDHGPFDIIFIDWSMPNMNGMEFIQHIKRHEDSADTKLVMITGTEVLNADIMAQSLGIHAYLVKPIDSNKIAAIINSHA